MSLGSVDMSVDARRLSSGFWARNVAGLLRTSTVAFKSAEKRVNATLGNMSFDSVTKPLTEAEELASARSKLLMDGMKLRVDDALINFDQIEMDVSVENILVAFLELEAQMSREQWNVILTGEESSNPSSFLETLSEEELTEQVNRQLSVSPKVDIGAYKFISDGKEISIKGFAEMKPGATMETFKEDQNIWPYLISDLTVKLSPDMIKDIGFNASKMGPQQATQEQTNQLVDMQLGQYIQMGFLRQEEDYLISDVKVADDVLFINGRPVMRISQTVAAMEAAQQAQEQAAPTISE